MDAWKKGQVVGGARLIRPTYVVYGKQRPRKAWLVDIEGERKILEVWQLQTRKGRPGRLTAALNEVYGQYAYRCKKENRYWGLSREEFKGLVSQNCVYCDAKPANGSSRHRGHFRYNGIDRKDNRKGYTPANSVPCCKFCNQVKSDVLSFEEMLAAMKAILKVRKAKRSQRRRS
jgi:hypothetical protein